MLIDRVLIFRNFVSNPVYKEWMFSLSISEHRSAQIPWSGRDGERSASFYCPPCQKSTGSSAPYRRNWRRTPSPT